MAKKTICPKCQRESWSAGELEDQEKLPCPHCAPDSERFLKDAAREPDSKVLSADADGTVALWKGGDIKEDMTES